MRLVSISRRRESFFGAIRTRCERNAPRRTINEIQRTWSYLEPLFIHSDEVKRELPVDAERFAGIDVEIKDILTTSVTQRQFP